MFAGPIMTIHEIVAYQRTVRRNLARLFAGLTADRAGARYRAALRADPLR